LHILRFVNQAQNQSAQFTFERKQNVRAAELRTGGHTESAANLRSSAAARAHNAQRPPSYRHDEDSEISCLISEDDARQALQRQVIVASSVDFARLGEFSSLDSLQPWSDATQAVIEEVSSKVKNTGLTK
jgi:hypothetical protein